MKFSQNSELKKMISLNTDNTLSPTVENLFLNIKNKFGFATCIGSDDFYLYTRQMMLHLNLEQANDISIDADQNIDLNKKNFDLFQNQNKLEKLKSPPKMKKYYSNSDDMDTSFAKASTQQIKQLLKTEIHDVKSQYELSNIQLAEKSFQNPIQSSVQNLSECDRKRSNSIQNKLLNYSDILKEFIIYPQAQIGTTKQKNPIQWIYSQIQQIKPQTLKLAFLMSSYLIFEIPLSSKTSQNAKKLQKQVHIKKTKIVYDQILRELSNFQEDQKQVIPQIILICSIHENQNQQKEKDQMNLIFQKYFGKKQTEAINSPFYQYHLTTPSKSHLPPTPKRFPLSLKEDSDKKIRLQFRIVSQNLSKSGVLRQDYSRMREITLQGKSIFNEMNPKIIQGNQIQPFCYMQLLKKLLLDVQFNENLANTFYQEWQKVYSKYLQQNIQETIEDYKDKICQLTLGKSIISNLKLQQAHQIAKRQTLKHLSQKKIGKSRVLIKSINSIKSGQNNYLPSSSLSHNRKISISRKLQESKCSMNNDCQANQQDLVYFVQSKLNILKQEMQQKNKINSIAWGHKFLETEYKAIQKKLASNQLKSIPMFKQQLQLFRQFFIKKLESHSAFQPELVAQYQNFAFNKIFQGMNALIQREKDDLMQTVRKLQKNNLQLQAQLKQVKKKQINKDKMAVQNQEEQLKKNQQLNLTIENLQNILEQQERKFKMQKSDLQCQIAKLQEKIFKIESQNKQSNSLKDQQLDEIKIKLQKFGFQLEKEQLLHQQTHENYQQIIAVMKQSQTKLNTKIQKLTQQTLQKQNKLKQSCQKQHQQTQQARKQFSVEIQNLQNQIQCKVFQNDKLQDEIRKLKDLHQIEIKSLKETMSQLQLQNKILQQKNTQIQFQLQKYKTFQTNTHKIIQEKQKINIKNKQAEQVVALLQQKQIFIHQQLQNYKHKNLQLSEKYHQTLVQAQKWKEQCQNKNKQLNKQIQTEPDQRIQHLKLAQKMVQELQSQYLTTKNQLAKYKIILKSPIYSHLK